MSASDEPSSNQPATAAAAAPTAADAPSRTSADANAPGVAHTPGDAPVPADAPAPADAPVPADTARPTDAPPEVQSLGPGAADEMIARAADEQIDQLLAKADVERTAQEAEIAASSVAPADVGSASAVATSAAEELPPQAPIAPAPVAQKQADYDEFSASVTENKADAEASAKGKPEAAVAAVSQSTAQDAPSQPDAPQTDVVEPDEQHQDAAPEQATIPTWLIPLELVNRPFETLPDSIRSALGKAAILTLINATALLIYVFKFRK